jgi:hypothetical protein
MNILDMVTLKARCEKLGKLKTEYILLKKNRDKLIRFIKYPKILIGIDINASYGNIDAPLLFAPILTDDFELFSIILKLNVDKNIISRGKNIAFLIFTSTKDNNFLKYLEDENYDFNAYIEYKENKATPLLLTIGNINYAKYKNIPYNDLLERLDILLNKKIDVNLSYNNSLSPLMLAIQSESIDIIQKLIISGVEIKRKYYIDEIKKEITCLDYYLDLVEKNEIKSNEEIVKLLT